MRGIVSVLAVFAFVVGCSSEPQPPAPVGYQPTPVQPGQPVPVQPVPGQPPQPLQQVPAPVPPGQPVQPVQPGANQIGNLLNTLGQMAGQQPGQPGQPSQPPAAGTHIPWQNLSQALPTAAPGWTMKGQVKGESVNMMGISVSQAECELVKGGMEAEVQIVDTTMNPLIAMPFNMARSLQVDSDKERLGPINFGVYPGTQKFDKKRGKTEIMVMVHNRVLVTLNVKGAPNEAEAQALGQYVNYALLAGLVGG